MGTVIRPTPRAGESPRPVVLGSPVTKACARRGDPPDVGLTICGFVEELLLHLALGEVAIGAIALAGLRIRPKLDGRKHTDARLRPACCHDTHPSEDLLKAESMAPNNDFVHVGLRSGPNATDNGCRC